jgi:hypothetical protein
MAIPVVLSPSQRQQGGVSVVIYSFVRIFFCVVIYSFGLVYLKKISNIICLDFYILIILY